MAGEQGKATTNLVITCTPQSTCLRSILRARYLLWPLIYASPCSHPHLAFFTQNSPKRAVHKSFVMTVRMMPNGMEQDFG